ncbi:hypothetical protein BH10BAC4_BH10BAC4_21470 [soil metagenome]
MSKVLLINNLSESKPTMSGPAIVPVNDRQTFIGNNLQVPPVETPKSAWSVFCDHLTCGTFFSGRNWEPREVHNHLISPEYGMMIKESDKENKD